MLSEMDYEMLHLQIENYYPYSQVKLRINELEFCLRSVVIKSKFNIICLKIIKENICNIFLGTNDPLGINKPYEIICDTRIVKSYYNKQKAKLSKRQYKMLGDALTEETKKDIIYKSSIWKNSEKFIAHLKKLEKAGNKIERI